MASAIWAAARLGVMLVALRGVGMDRKTVIAAWAIGLLPYLAGATVGLRVLTFAASAYLTRRRLLALSVPRDDTGRAIRWAFGGQAAVVRTAWFVQAVLPFI